MSSYYSDRGCYSFNAYGDSWLKKHIPLLDCIIHGFAAYKDLPQDARDRLLNLFFRGCDEIACPVDFRPALLDVLTQYKTYTRSSLDNYLSVTSIKRWRRRVVIAMAQLVVNDCALQYHS